MPLVVQNSKNLINTPDLRLKVLLFAMPGWGKTDWASRAPNPGIIACDDGHGCGLLTVAASGVDYVVPANIDELNACCSGEVFKDKQTLILDSATHACMVHAKNEALRVPRPKGDSLRRFSGVPELDDYGTIGELMRRPLRRLLMQPKHVIVTATLRVREPREGQTGPTIIGPELPGALMTVAAAMFDLVLCGLTRQKLLRSNDPKSRVTERYFLTQPFGAYIAKSRLEIIGKTLLPEEVVVNRETGEGSFLDILGRLQAAYAEIFPPPAPGSGV